MKTIYHNGAVYTGSDSLAQAFAVENGRFVFTGSSAEALTMAAPGDETVDLGGRFVCPGFNDSHMHVLSYGHSLTTAQLAQHTTSLKEMLEYGRKFAAESKPAEGAWIIGRGWNQDYFTDTKRLPTRWDLDTVSTENPVCFVRCCGHALVVNSKALEIIGITADTPSPEGGAIGVTDGELNGQFFDNAMNYAYGAIPAPNKEDVKRMLRSAFKALNSYGVTSAQTDDYIVFNGLDWRTVNEAYKELEQSGEMTVRVYEQSNHTTLESLKEFIAEGNVTGAGSELFRIGPLKMLGDGSLGARTAYVSGTYADDPSTCGFPVFTTEEMNSMVSYANANGMQVAIHAIGDACLDMVLDAIEGALKENPRADHRHGVVHCQISRAEQLQRIIDLNLHIYAQSIFLDYDIHMLTDRVGEERASTSYSWKTLMDGGVSVSNGTDCPVELPDALAGMQCAVTRTTLRDHIGPYLPAQAFTAKEALDSYTIRGAEASFEESFKGLIAPGYLADFVMLDRNILEVPADEIKDIKPLAAWLGGREVFRA